MSILEECVRIPQQYHSMHCTNTTNCLVIGMDVCTCAAIIDASMHATNQSILINIMVYLVVSHT